jgi:hypothetical protein
VPPWISYSLVRFGLFAAIFAGLLLLGVHWLAAAAIAAVAGFCVSYIFFRSHRDRIARGLAERRARDAALPASDEDAEGDGAAAGDATGRPTGDR